MKYAVANITKAVILGRQGENEVTTIKFPISEWLNDFDSGGTFTLVNIRPSETAESAYPCVITNNDEFVYWIVKEADLVYSGIGKCELIYTVGTQIMKSAVFSTNVLESIEGGSAEPPEPYQDWIEHISQIAGEIQVDLTKKVDVWQTESLEPGSSVYNRFKSGASLMYLDGNLVIAGEYNQNSQIATFYYIGTDKNIYAITIDRLGIVYPITTPVGNIHSHSNKSTLDKFGESGGNPTFNGVPIGGGSGESGIEIVKTTAGTDRSLYTPAELKAFIDDAVPLFYNGNTVVSYAYLDDEYEGYFTVYVFIGAGNFFAYQINLDKSITSLSNINGTTMSPTEKEKLANIEARAEVNKVDDVQDEQGNSLINPGTKIAIIPNQSLTDTQIIEVCSLFADFISDENGNILGADSSTAIAF